MDIIFDFDGVIINSHKVKTKAFYQIFRFYGEAIALKAKRYHEKWQNRIVWEKNNG